MHVVSRDVIRGFSQTRVIFFLVTSGVGYLAGRLEDNATPDFDRVVGEAFIEPAQQRNIDRGLHAVRPLPFFEQGEQVLA
jgi:hypothetical protein